MRTVVVLGASDKPERKSNEAVKLLQDSGYRVVPVNPNLESIGDIPVMHALSESPEEPDALSIYVNADRSSMLKDDILRLEPSVVIFNPGAENEELEAELQENGVTTFRACTVVSLKSGNFEKFFETHEQK